MRSYHVLTHSTVRYILILYLLLSEFQELVVTTGESFFWYSTVRYGMLWSEHVFDHSTFQLFQCLCSCHMLTIRTMSLNTPRGTVHKVSDIAIVPLRSEHRHLIL
jgi:hypothetical protein